MRLLLLLCWYWLWNKYHYFMAVILFDVRCPSSWFYVDIPRVSLPAPKWHKTCQNSENKNEKWRWSENDRIEPGRTLCLFVINQESNEMSKTWINDIFTGNWVFISMSRSFFSSFSSLLSLSHVLIIEFCPILLGALITLPCTTTTWPEKGRTFFGSHFFRFSGLRSRKNKFARA